MNSAHSSHQGDLARGLSDSPVWHQPLHTHGQAQDRRSPYSTPWIPLRPSLHSFLDQGEETEWNLKRLFKSSGSIISCIGFFFFCHPAGRCRAGASTRYSLKYRSYTFSHYFAITLNRVESIKILTHAVYLQLIYCQSTILWLKKIFK